MLGVGNWNADDLYRALDWLGKARPAIERHLARQHLVGATLVLYACYLHLADRALLRAARSRALAQRQARRSADRTLA